MTKMTGALSQAMLDPAGKEMITKLKAMKGADFDKAYLMGQLDGHKKLLMIQEDTSRSARTANT
jgi:putative membrane protein